MAKKSYYKPKPKNKPLLPSEPTLVPVEEIKEELPKQEEIVIDNSNDGQEIQLSPLSPQVFCNQKKIVGLNKAFLEKKYATKSYTLKVWEEILIKEKIS